MPAKRYILMSQETQQLTALPLGASIALANMEKLPAEKHGCTQVANENKRKRTKVDYENY
jgi:hypothetical protein